MSLNLEEKYVSSGYGELRDLVTDESEFIELYWLVANHLMVLKQFDHAVIYLKKMQKYYEDKFNIKEALKTDSRQREVLEMRNSLGDIGISKYINTLHLITKCLFEMNLYDEGEKYHSLKFLFLDVIQNIGFKLRI